jgi:branched-chain amino acid transport system ATP-binding protein
LRVESKADSGDALSVHIDSSTSRPTPHGSIIETRDLTFGFGGDLVTNHVSLTVQEGEFLSIIGPNGAGKTTFFNLLTGLYRPSAGHIFYRGTDISHTNAAARAQLGLARSFQVSNIFPTLSAHENVRLAAQARRAYRFQLLRPFTAYRRDIDRADEALSLVGLSHLRFLPAVGLSHGDKRKLELAMVIAAQPDVVLLDEPTSGVSAEDVPSMVALIRRIREVEGKTVVMVEHKIGVVLELSDRIAVLHQGQLLALGTPQEIQGNSLVQSAYLGQEEL